MTASRTASTRIEDLRAAAAVLEGEHPSVWIVDAAGHAQQRFVTLGIAGANSQEITSGINAGDRHRRDDDDRESLCDQQRRAALADQDGTADRRSSEQEHQARL